MPDITFVYSFVQENFPNVSISRNGTHFNFRCPFCGDSEKNIRKKRFHLQFKDEESIYYNCFNCNTSGSFYDLYGMIKGISSTDAYKDLNKFNPEIIKSRVKNSSYKSKEKIEYLPKNCFNDFLEKECIEDIATPNGLVETSLHNALLKFKEERRITQKLYVCKEGTFQKRIIIPVFDNDKCVFFQGRRILETMNPKYLNPSVEKENIILNKDNFERDKFIIITEGILDAYSIGNQGTTCLGASIPDDFFEILFTYTNAGVILALDNDDVGKKEMAKTIQKSSFNKRLYYFMLNDYKDLNEFYVKTGCPDVYKYILDNKYDYLDAYIKLLGVF